MTKNIKDKLKKLLRFFANPRLLLCIAIGWIITNGWSYIAFFVGTFFDIKWLTAVAGAYIAFLWLPISPEKIVTFAIAIFLLKRFFPDDTRTLAVLRELREKAKNVFSARRSGKKNKHNNTQEDKKISPHDVDVDK